MVLDIKGIPRVDKPLVGHLLACKIPSVHDLVGQLLTLLLELVVEDKDTDLGLGDLLALGTELLGLDLEILGQLPHGVGQCAAGIIDLIDNQDVAADEGGLGGVKVEPLGLDDLGLQGEGLIVLMGGLPDLEILVERQTDGLDGDVLVVLLLQEGSLLWPMIVPVVYHFVGAKQICFVINLLVGWLLLYVGDGEGGFIERKR